MKKFYAVIMVLTAAAFVAGCFTSATAYTKKTSVDGAVTESRVSIIGTGDKVSQVAAEGLFADGSDEDLGAGVKNASASQQSTGIGETLKGVGDMMSGMAQFMAATQGVQAQRNASAPLTPSPVTGTAVESATPTVAPAVSRPAPVTSVPASASNIAAKIAEAKATGKPLVVIAGNEACGYCVKLDNVLDASPAFTGRADIILYREMSPWESNQALKWTGGGNAPLLRVTQWAADGSTFCDTTVERPQTIAAIEAALSACVAPK